MFSCVSCLSRHKYCSHLTVVGIIDIVLTTAFQRNGKLFRLTTSNTSRSVIDVGIRFGFLPPRLSTAALTIASLLFTFSGTIGSISGKLLETKNSLTHVSLIRPSEKRNIATVTKREHLICVLRTNCLFSVFVAASVFFLVYLKSMLVLGHGNPISMLSRIFPRTS